MWAGDMNGSLTRSSYAHDRLLQQFTDETMLHPPEQVATPTYYHFTQCARSQIDYILCDKALRDVCSSYKVLEREPLNISSHDPVIAKFKLSFQIPKQDHPPRAAAVPRPKWERIDLEIYQDNTEAKCRSIIASLHSMTLEDLIRCLEEAFREAALGATTSHRKSNPKRMRPWTPRMTLISKQEKLQFWLWKQEGKPTDANNSTYSDLCQLKKLFRKEQRQTAARERLKKQDSIMKAHRGDDRTFYKLISRQRGSTSDLPDEMLINGESVSGDNLIKALEGYFHALATPKDLPQYDQGDKQKSELKNEFLKQKYIQNPTKILPPISPQLILEVIHTLNRGKAPDPAGIMVEHLIYASPLAASVLAEIMNRIIDSQEIPNILKEGVISPVFKKKKSPRDPDNFRRITITMLFSKVLEKILQYPLKAIITPQLNNLQRGFTEGSSATNAALLITEAAADAQDRGAPMFVLFLDASKAFDVVYQKSMLNSIHDLHITGDLWMLLNNSYEDMTSCLKWKGQLSETFPEGQGIRQGGLNSTILFNGRGNPFLNKLERSGVGKTIGSIYVGAPTCADDIALLADTATDLQMMTELAWLESTKERFEYSTSKSKAMVFTKKREPVNPGLLMNNQVVELSTKETHLGIVRTNDNRANEAVQERIKTARKTTYALLGTGIYGINCLHPKVSLRILETYVQPTLGYGFETLNLTASNTQELEAFMRGLLRRIQLLPQESASCANHILLWEPYPWKHS